MTGKNLLTHFIFSMNLPGIFMQQLGLTNGREKKQLTCYQEKGFLKRRVAVTANYVALMVVS